MKRFIFTILIIALVIMFVMVVSRGDNNGTDVVDTNTPVATDIITGTPMVFAWRYAESIVPPDNLLKTQIFLDITYSNNQKSSTEIDTVDGSCNAIDPSPDDTDMHTGTTKVQCYAAGLGHWFKIVQSNGVYTVQRKTFEESLPDHTPSDYQWETVVQVDVSV